MVPHHVAQPVSNRPKVGAAPVLGTYVLLALVGFVPLWIIAVTDTPRGSAWAGAYVAAAIAGARFAWLMTIAQRRLFEMTTWLFFYVFLGIAAMVQLRQGVDPDTTKYLNHNYDWAAVGIVIVAEMALLAGLTLGRGPSAAAAAPRRVIDRTRTVLYSVVVIGGALAYASLIGFSMLFAARSVRGAAASQAFGDDVVGTVVRGFVTFGLLVAVVAQIYNWRERREQGKKRTVFLITISTIVLVFMVNPIASPRYVFGVVALGLLGAWGAYSTLRRYRLASVSSIAGIILLFPVLDSFRHATGEIEAVDPIAAFQSGDFDAFAQIINTLEYVTAHGPTWGYQLLGVPLFWVPRSVWPSKPVDTGIFLAEFKGYWFTNLSAPLPAELFINGSWLLLVVGMIAFGVMIRRLDRGSQLGGSTGFPTVLGCIVPFYMILLLRGSLLQAMANLAVILVSWWFVSRRASADALNYAPTRPASARRMRRRSEHLLPPAHRP